MGPLRLPKLGQGQVSAGHRVLFRQDVRNANTAFHYGKIVRGLL